MSDSERNPCYTEKEIKEPREPVVTARLSLSHAIGSGLTPYALQSAALHSIAVAMQLRALLFFSTYPGFGASRSAYGCRATPSQAVRFAHSTPG